MVKMGTVWDRTAEFLTDNLPTILPVALIAFFVPFSVMGSFQPLVTETTPGLRLVLELILVLSIVVVSWGMLTLTAMVLDGGDGGASRIAAKRLLPALAVGVTAFLAMLLLFAPIVLALMVSGIDLAAIARGAQPDVSMPASVAWSIGIYGLLATLVCVWVGARLAVVNAVIVREKTMFGAIRRSWTLTRGVVWRIVGVAFLYTVVSNVAALAAQLVFGTIFSLIAGGGGGTLSLASVLTSVVVATVQTGFTVLAPVFAAKLYVALASERERAVQS